MFDKMTDLSQGLACGGSSHEIIYLDGPKFDINLAPTNADMSLFTLIEVSTTRMQMTGAADDFSWLGIHTIQIKATNGRKD